MTKKYFGFGLSDGMFQGESYLKRIPLTKEEAKQWVDRHLENNQLSLCLNPSHSESIRALRERYEISVPIPPKAAVIKMGLGDELLVMSPRGLPRLEGRHEYTEKEIGECSFEFAIWHVL